MKYVFTLVSAAFLLVAGTAFAADFVKNSDGVVSLAANESHHNLYTAGNSINIASNTTGDLIAAGNSITVSGSTEANIEAAGNSINLNGSIGRNLRAAGNSIEISGHVGGDVLAAGSKIRINSTVDGDVVVAGRTLEFGPNAKVSGHVKYYGDKTPIVEQGAQVGTIDHISPKAHDFRRVGRAVQGFGTVVSFIAWLIASLLLVWIFPKRTSAVVEMVNTKFGANFGYGLLGLVVTPFAIVLLFVTLVGYYTALIVFALYVVLLMISSLIAANFAGAKIMSWYHKSTSIHINAASAIIGVIVFKLVAMIPVLGWLVCAVLALISFGALLRFAFSDIKTNH